MADPNTPSSAPPMHTLAVIIGVDRARATTLELRRKFDAQLEYLIDALWAPRGFWGHSVGHQVDSMRSRVDADE